MPPRHHHHHETVRVSGTVTHVFGHRFVLETSDGPVLADLTPHGADAFALKSGAVLTIEGEQKSSEIKVTHVSGGKRSVAIAHKGPPGHDHADPEIALKAARAGGYEIVGAPRRKPKHFEVLGKRDRHLYELHIELDGHIRKAKDLEYAPA